MGTLSAAMASMKEGKRTNAEPHIEKDKIVLVHYAKIYPDPHQYSHLGKTPEEYEQEVRELKDEIEAVGEVLQPILLRKRGADDFYVLGGRHRRDACQLLVEEDGKTKYEFIPAIVKKVTEAQAEYIVLGSNTMWEKTDWHIMHEITRKKYLIENFPEDFPFIPDKGRMIEKLAVAMKMPKSTVGEYLQISNNLSEKAMDAFEKQQLNKSAAVEMAKLSHEEQDALLVEGVTKQKDIKAYKEEKVEKTVHRTTVTDTIKTTSSRKVKDNTADRTENSSDVVDVLPGQYRVANTDMDIEETKDLIIEETISNETSNIQGRCTCGNCKLPSRIEDTFKFNGKSFCMNCLYDLILDIADSGIIKLDMSAVEKDGIIVRS